MVIEKAVLLCTVCYLSIEPRFLFFGQMDAFLGALKARGLVLNEPRVRQRLPKPGKLPLGHAWLFLH